MLRAPHVLLLAGFALLMAMAAVSDWRRLVIPNRLVAALGALWLLHYATTAPRLLAGLETAACAAAIFIAGALLFSRGLIGGGDVKLLSAAALWAGADRVAPLLLATGLLGGALSLLFLTPLGSRFAAARQGPALPPDAIAAASGAGTGRVPVPYGVAIAGAALIVTLPPQLA